MCCASRLCVRLLNHDVPDWVATRLHLAMRKSFMGVKLCVWIVNFCCAMVPLRIFVVGSCHRHEWGYSAPLRRLHALHSTLFELQSEPRRQSIDNCGSFNLRQSPSKARARRATSRNPSIIYINKTEPRSRTWSRKHMQAEPSHPRKQDMNPTIHHKIPNTYYNTPLNLSPNYQKVTIPLL